jgi:hypothetical protein
MPTFSQRMERVHLQDQVVESNGKKKSKRTWRQGDLSVNKKKNLGAKKCRKREGP